LLLYAGGGVSYNEAMRMPPDERLALKVVFGTLRGGTFEWRTLSWSKAPTIG